MKKSILILAAVFVQRIFAEPSDSSALRAYDSLTESFVSVSEMKLRLDSLNPANPLTHYRSDPQFLRSLIVLKDAGKPKISRMNGEYLYSTRNTLSLEVGKLTLDDSQRQAVIRELQSVKTASNTSIACAGGTAAGLVVLLLTPVFNLFGQSAFFAPAGEYEPVKPRVWAIEGGVTAACAVTSAAALASALKHRKAVRKIAVRSGRNDFEQFLRDRERTDQPAKP